MFRFSPSKSTFFKENRIEEMKIVTWFVLLLSPLIAGAQETSGDEEGSADAMASAGVGVGQDPFTFRVHRTQEEGGDLVLRLVVKKPVVENSWIADAKVYWAGPSGVGMQFNLEPVIEGIFSSRMPAEIEEGEHRLLVSFAVRGDSGFVERFHEREYGFLFPQMHLAAGEERIFPDQANEAGPALNVGEDANRKSAIRYFVLGMALIAISSLAWFGFFRPGFMKSALVRETPVLGSFIGLFERWFAGRFGMPRISVGGAENLVPVSVDVLPEDQKGESNDGKPQGDDEPEAKERSEAKDQSKHRKKGKGNGEPKTGSKENKGAVIVEAGLGGKDSDGEDETEILSSTF
jgi:hypothetical protein